jgi:hypothetical protein
MTLAYCDPVTIIAISFCIFVEACVVGKSVKKVSERTNGVPTSKIQYD